MNTHTHNLKLFKQDFKCAPIEAFFLKIKKVNVLKTTCTRLSVNKM